MKHSPAEPTKNIKSNWDLVLSPMAMHYAPVVLAIITFTLTLAGWSVFRRFEENKPGTMLSLSLMWICFILCFSALRKPDLSAGKRKIALLFTPVIGLAILDEYYQWHEEIGYYVQRNVTQLPRTITHYTDDVIILMTAIIGCVILFRLMKGITEKKALIPYFGMVVVFAVLHGMSDLASHGLYLWSRLWPDLSHEEIFTQIEVFSCYEELFKIWCEWFTVLFLTKLFYDRDSPLSWNIQICFGSMLTLVGLWSIRADAFSIPWLWIGGELKFIRNYHHLFFIGWLWMFWSTITWSLFRDSLEKRTAMGWFFLCPFALFLTVAIPESRFTAFVQWIAAHGLPDSPYRAGLLAVPCFFILLMLPGVLLGWLGGRALRQWPNVSLYVAFGLGTWFLVTGKTSPINLANLLKVGALTFYLCWFYLLSGTGQNRWQAIFLILLTVFSTGHYVLMELLLGLTIIIVLNQSGLNLPSIPPKRRCQLLLAHLLAVALIFVLYRPRLITNLQYYPSPGKPFNVYQEPDYPER